MTRRRLLSATKELASRDRDLARSLRACGPPPLWARRPGFRTLVQIILEQQVSLAAGRAALRRLEHLGGTITPERIVTLGVGRIRGAGVTRQKARYLVELACAVSTGELPLSRLGRLDDEPARTALTSVVGIGPWTADVYLLMALRRTDVWPVGDLALAKAAQAVKKLPTLPTPEELETLGSKWVPLRAVAARMLWHHYLSGT